MKKVLLIGGGLAVVGGLAYLYLKNKKKEEAILTGGTSATQPSVTPTTGVGASSINSEIPPLSTGGIIPSNTTPSIKNQMEIDAILDSLNKNLGITRSFSQSKIAKSKATRQMELLKNDLSRFGYGVKEGTGGLFLVKI
jgi:hypothetical protein